MQNEKKENHTKQHMRVVIVVKGEKITSLFKTQRLTIWNSYQQASTLVVDN